MLVDVVHLNLGIDRHYEILGVDELWAATLHRIDEHDFRRYGFGVFQPSCGEGFGCEWCIEYGLYGRCVFLCDRFCRFLMYRDTSRGAAFLVCVGVAGISRLKVVGRMVAARYAA